MKLTKSKLTEMIRTTLKEAIDPSYNHRYYNIVMFCTIDRQIGGEREETLREIRGIPNVTTVSVEEGSVHKYENKYKMRLNIKYVLIGTESTKKYLNSVLLSGLRKIKGLGILDISLPTEIK
jgi:hypothetical protein